ncbi:MAG: hypothetical protein OXI76_09795 [Gemmatimonadota bacterium]|nr:hypothetical protein [Gemmatimonadota bacterium]MXX33505.1 hypothetical protein [Gemmatimonadota bacterium]MYD13303.1 hypothetical protein [Gemmatimonadota bacterium]
MARTAVLLVVAALSASACVRYVNVDLERAAAGEDVRVRLTDEGAVRAARHLGRIATELDADVRPRPADSVAVVIWLGRNYAGTQFADVRETIVFPESEVQDFHLRELSPQRTAVALGGAAIVFVFLVDQIFLQEDPNRPPGNDRGNPPPARMTVFRIPIGWIP